MVAPFDAAWSVLKALPEYQMFYPADERSNLTEEPYTYELGEWGDGIDVGERQVGAGTVHPAIYGMMQRRMKQMDDERLAHHGGSSKTAEEYLPHLNLRSLRANRRDADATRRFYGGEVEEFSDDDDELRRVWFMHREPMIDGHPDRQADESPYPLVENRFQGAYPIVNEDGSVSFYDIDEDNEERATVAPQSHDYKYTHPTAKEIRRRMGL